MFHSCSIQSGNYFPPSRHCGYFLGLLSSSLLISGGGYVLSWQYGVELVQFFWVGLVLCWGEGLHWSCSFGIAVVFFLIVALVLMVLHTRLVGCVANTMAMGCYMQCWAGIARSLDCTIMGL